MLNAPLKLLIDVGNTRLKWCVVDSTYEGEYVSRGVAESSVSGAATLISFIENDLSRDTEAWLCCVASPHIKDLIMEALAKRCSIAPISVRVSQQALGVVNHYSDPAQLGVDRWVAIIGLSRRLQSCSENDSVAHGIVVDAGTAITVDLLESGRDYRGGVILPGPELMQTALNQNTANIEAGLLDSPSSYGRTTSECVSVGLNIGIPGAIRAVIGRMMSSLEGEAYIYLCGGGAQPLMQSIQGVNDLMQDNQVWSRAHMCVAPDLVFEGLLALSESGGSA